MRSFMRLALAASIGAAVVAGTSQLACRAEDKAKEEVAYVRAMQEYVYGFPLVMMEVTRQVMTATPTSGEYAAPMDQFGRIRTVVRWDFTNCVRISTNSLWSYAFLDLKDEPRVVSFPDGKDVPTAWRILNHWTDVFATGGSRQPEQNAGDYLVVGPGWNGTAPANVKKVLRSSTRYATVLVEMASAGPQDFPRIHALQDQLKVTPLAAWGRPYAPPAAARVDPGVDLTATPYDQVRLMTGEMFFKRLAALLKDNPPYEADKSMVEKLAKLGVVPGEEFDPAKLDPAVRKGIDEAPATIWMKFAIGAYGMKAPNGWITTLDIGRFGTDYATRAYVAYMGLGAGVKEDIVYPTAFVDSEGRPLDGAFDYTIHLEKADLGMSQIGVWSFSPYRENFYVHNALDRYGILPNGPKYNPDGSLDIYLQASSPGREKEPNWLPMPPTGLVNVSLRIYVPTKEVLDGTFKIPPIKRVGLRDPTLAVSH